MKWVTVQTPEIQVQIFSEVLPRTIQVQGEGMKCQVLMKYCSRSRGTGMKTELAGRLHDQVFVTNTSTVYRCSMRTL